MGHTLVPNAGDGKGHVLTPYEGFFLSALCRSNPAQLLWSGGDCTGVTTKQCRLQFVGEWQVLCLRHPFMDRALSCLHSWDPWVYMDRPESMLGQLVEE